MLDQCKVFCFSEGVRLTARVGHQGGQGHSLVGRIFKEGGGMSNRPSSESHSRLFVSLVPSCPYFASMIHNVMLLTGWWLQTVLHMPYFNRQKCGDDPQVNNSFRADMGR